MNLPPIRPNRLKKDKEERSIYDQHNYENVHHAGTPPGNIDEDVYDEYNFDRVSQISSPLHGVGHHTNGPDSGLDFSLTRQRSGDSIGCNHNSNTEVQRPIRQQPVEESDGPDDILQGHNFHVYETPAEVRQQNQYSEQPFRDSQTSTFPVVRNNMKSSADHSAGITERRTFDSVHGMTTPSHAMETKGRQTFDTATLDRSSSSRKQRTVKTEPLNTSQTLGRGSNNKQRAVHTEPLTGSNKDKLSGLGHQRPKSVDNLLSKSAFEPAPYHTGNSIFYEQLSERGKRFFFSFFANLYI